jgi:hypothetical protein
MLRSERHVALNPADTAASSGRAAATMVLITSGGKSVNLARELLVTTMMLEPTLSSRQSYSSDPVVILLYVLRQYQNATTALNSTWRTGVCTYAHAEVRERTCGAQACEPTTVVLCNCGKWHAW